ncbi:MAG: helix-turn-helix domain-containing protein [Sphingobacterium sp.]|jgi:hypothetical protein|nr:helix-turn-helix domain-containing protein [Sphingobacterium sp.]
MRNRSEAIYQTLLAMLQLLQERKMTEQAVPEATDTAVPPALKTYSDEELMTVKEAYLELKISRNTLDQLRREQKLTSVFKKRNVRLIRTEVEAAKKWYSLIKGKS